MKVKNRKAISELLSYVLLITIALAMAGGVYAYLRFLAEEPLPEEPCQDISVIIKNYYCENNEIYIAVENRGLFKAAAKIRIYNGSGNLVGEEDVEKIDLGEERYSIREIGIKETKSVLIPYTSQVTKIELIPFKLVEGFHKLCPEVKIVEEFDACPQAPSQLPR